MATVASMNTARSRSWWCCAASVAIGIVTILSGCGAARTSEGADASISPPGESLVSAPVLPPATGVPTITRIDEAATVTTRADRLDEAVRLTWIGGSEIELEDRSLPDAVAGLAPIIDSRPLVVFADTKIAPLPSEVETRVRRAAGNGADGLVVALNPSWLSWDGHIDCAEIAEPHEFYTCVLQPRPGTDVDGLRGDVARLIDTIVATGLPSYLYVIPHSAESLADPQLALLLGAAETKFAELDPHLDRITYVGHVLSRDLEPLREGAEFNDMVHPSPSGVERLAAFFATEFSRVFATVPLP